MAITMLPVIISFTLTVTAIATAIAIVIAIVEAVVQIIMVVIISRRQFEQGRSDPAASPWTCPLRLRDIIISATSMLPGLKCRRLRGLVGLEGVEFKVQESGLNLGGGSFRA